MSSGAICLSVPSYSRCRSKANILTQAYFENAAACPKKSTYDNALSHVS